LLSREAGKRKTANTKGRVLGCVRKRETLKPQKKNLHVNLVGKANIVDVDINQLHTKALIDTGSQVTTLSSKFFTEYMPRETILELSELITVTGAGGHILPYIGYVELNITVDGDMYCVPTLIMEGERSADVPLIIGTNLLSLIYNGNKQEESRCKLQPSLSTIIQNMAKMDVDVIGTVKTTKETPIPPGKTVAVKGLTRSYSGMQCCRMSVLTEESPDQALPGGLRVIPSVLNILPQGTSTSRIYVEILNTSSKHITIPGGHKLCQLQRVDVVTSAMDTSADKDSGTKKESLLDHFTLPEDPKQAESLKKLLLKWEDVFALTDEDHGHTDAVRHGIKLTDDTPIKIRHRRIPPSMYTEVKEHLKRMVKEGDIRPSKSPWSFPVVLIRKRDSSLRFCVDYRELNKRTVRDALSLPRIEETLDALAGAKYFSCLDLKNGYWQVEMAEKDKEKTAFTVGPLGFYEFNSMPFGLTNSPATFQRLMQTCMGDLHLAICLLFLDDIIIYSSTWEQHLERLEAVFRRLQEYGLKLKPSKCSFAKTEVKYLGHIVSEDGIMTDPEKVSAVTNWPVPSSTKELQQFLGFIGFYRKFVKDFSKIARPLNDLLKGQGGSKKTKTVKLDWGEAQQVAFEELKKKLSTAPILGYADYSLPFELHVDACTSGLGAILYQKQDNKLRVIAYASRRLSASEKNYSAHKLEFLALKWAIVEKFHDYLYGQPFTVFTDNNPLTYVLTSAKLDATGHRWLATISGYNFSIHYKTGKANIDADTMSRLPTIQQDVIQSVCEIGFKPAVLVLPADECCLQMLNTSETSTINPLDVGKLQSEDEVLYRLIQHLKSGSKPGNEEMKEIPELRKYIGNWEK